jgi:LytS/YehU family sensor histidine kinase
VLVSDRPNEALAPRDGSAAGPRSREPFGNLPNFFAKAFVSFLFSGGFGLLGWRRERDGLARVTAERELRESETRRRETELKLSVLAAQVEPHFLFNTLASVRSAIATDPARASEMIDRLVDYLRASIPRLRGDGSADTTLGSQVEIVQAYLHLMRTRMKRLQISIDVPDDLRDAHFPPLMLISLAENAVKHGVEPKVGSARVGISARRIGAGLLEVSVADDGVGFGLSESGSGLGLVNIRERLRQLYGERASLALKSRAEGGVEATLALPLEFAGAAA